MFNEDEHFFNCPYCFQNISMVLETFYSGQKYIEDCEVCCNPIEIYYEVAGGEISYFSCDRA